MLLAILSLSTDIEDPMKYVIASALVAVMFFGCEKVNTVDTTPPAIPQGLRTVSLDNAVQISWLPCQDADLAGYKVWESNRYDGEYHLLGTTTATTFTDDGAVNGVTSFYAVSSYDYAHNESALSKDVVYDTPRPEGYNVALAEVHTSPTTAGYEFASGTVGPYNDSYTDFYFDDASGRFMLDVWSDTDIQDMGYTATLDDISTAPSAGWAPSGTAEAIVGHTYVIWTKDNHYAKVRVRQVSSTGMTFDWAYQTAVGNPELKRSAGRPARPAEGLTGIRTPSK